MSLEQQVQSKIEKNILTLTLNRPEVLNALNETLCDQLFEQLASAEKNSSIRCIVIRGAGKHFMAGGDLKLFHSELNKKPDKRRIFFEKFVYNVHPLVQVIKRIPKPVLASVHGAVGGFGVSLMLVCDLVIAADSSYFTMAYGNIGTSPDGSSTYFLPRSVGLKKAMELSLLCDRFDANTAKTLGMINWIVPEAKLQTETENLSQRLSNGPTQAYANTKRLLNESLHSTLDQQLQNEAESFSDCAASNDFVEGINAFVEKRYPNFKGN